MRITASPFTCWDTRAPHSCVQQAACKQLQVTVISTQPCCLFHSGHWSQVPRERGLLGEGVTGYYSCCLSRTERNDCITWCKLLAIVIWLGRFLFTSLGASSNSRPITPCQPGYKTLRDWRARWRAGWKLQSFKIEIQHRADRPHPNTDWPLQHLLPLSNQTPARAGAAACPHKKLLLSHCIWCRRGRTRTSVCACCCGRGTVSQVICPLWIWENISLHSV